MSAPRVAGLALLALLTPARGDPPLALPDGPGRAEFERSCGLCHSLESVVRLRRTRAQWEAKIDAMIAKGAKVSDEDIEAIAAYLGDHFGPAEAR